MEIFPFAQIFRTIQKYSATLLELSGSDPEIGSRSVLPQERIAKAGELRIIRWLNHRLFPFVPSTKLRIGRRGEALHFAEIVIAVAERGAFRRSSFHTRVQDRGGSVVVDGAAGEAAVGIVPARSGSKRDGHVAPVNHVFADGVIPVHVAPNRGVRVVLIEHVVEAVPENRAVGIVHPVSRRKQMELRTKWVGGKTRLQRVFSEKSECGTAEGRKRSQGTGNAGSFQKRASRGTQKAPPYSKTYAVANSLSAARRRRTTRSWPSATIVSKSGGATAWPTMATRIALMSKPAFTPTASATARVAWSHVS